MQCRDRSKIRKKYKEQYKEGLEGNVCTDLLTSLCCMLCGLCQQEEQVIQMTKKEKVVEQREPEPQLSMAISDGKQRQR